MTAAIVAHVRRDERPVSTPAKAVPAISASGKLLFTARYNAHRSAQREVFDGLRFWNPT